MNDKYEDLFREGRYYFESLYGGVIRRRHNSGILSRDTNLHLFDKIYRGAQSGRKTTENTYALQYAGYVGVGQLTNRTSRATSKNSFEKTAKFGTSGYLDLQGDPKGWTRVNDLDASPRQLHEEAEIEETRAKGLLRSAAQRAAMADFCLANDYRSMTDAAMKLNLSVETLCEKIAV